MLGTKIIAKNNCIMEDGIKSLTKGVSYEIKEKSLNEFMILDDQNEPHFFKTSQLDGFFFVDNEKEELSKLTIKSIKHNIFSLINELKGNQISRTDEIELSSTLNEVNSFLNKINFQSL